MSVLEGPLVFVDIETNGLSYVRGRIIEVAAIRVENGQVVGSMNQLVDPGSELPAFITNLTGIRSSDLIGAPPFLQIADTLFELLKDAVFVAHNVRFDYSFLKHEFKRAGLDFRPKQLCTMRLSRALYPQERSHKLESLIHRHGFQVNRRHRAYDDAAVLHRFVNHVKTTFEPDVLHEAIAKQIKHPALPKGLSPELVNALPDTPGVYVFEDKKGFPLYVGKSVHIKQRVQAHFSSDHEHVSELKIAEQIHAIRTYQTAGELGALLLESRLIKELQPLYNRQLRRTGKLLLAQRSYDENGYARIALEESAQIGTDDTASILAVYASRGKAKQSIEAAVKTFSLCAKLCGLEKGPGACFPRQLGKCDGACVGDEPVTQYNERVLEAFAHHRVQVWPYSSPILITEGATEDQAAFIVDQWCVIGEYKLEPFCDPVVLRRQPFFDLDTYKILRSYILHNSDKIRVHPITPDRLAALYTEDFQHAVN